MSINDADVTETIQCAAWTICCAPPHAPKRATSGSAASAAFVTPLLRQAAAGRAGRAPPRLRLRHRRQPRAARAVRPRVRFRPDRRRPAHRPRVGPHAARARQRGGGAVSRRRPSISSRRSTCCTRSTTPTSARRSPRCIRVLQARAATSSSTSRRWTSLRGDHSVLSREVRRYSRASLRALLDARRLRRSSASPTRTRRCSCRCSPSRALQRRRGLREREPDAQQEITVPPGAGQRGR